MKKDIADIIKNAPYCDKEESEEITKIFDNLTEEDLEIVEEHKLIDIPDNKYTKTIEIHIDPVTSAITVHPAKGDPDLMDLMLSIKAMIDIGDDQNPGFKEQITKLLIEDIKGE